MYKQTNKRNVLLFYSFTPPSYKCCRDNYYNYWSNRIDLVITPHSIAHIWTSAINELLKLSEHANQWADLCPLLIDRLDFGKRFFSSDVLQNEIYLNSTHAIHINQTQNYGLETKMWYVFNAWPALFCWISFIHDLSEIKECKFFYSHVFYVYFYLGDLYANSIWRHRVLVFQFVWKRPRTASNKSRCQ